MSVIGLLILSTTGLVAQTNPVDAAAQPQRDGKVVVPERTTTTDDANVTSTTLRPPRLERESLPPVVQERLDRFKTEARAYLARQQELKKKLEGANDKERAAIREQLKEIQQQWLESAKEMRKEYKDRQAELAEKLKEYRELLDNVRSTTLRDTGGRTRRGDD
jgi:chromosome segregation ATPase